MKLWWLALSVTLSVSLFAHDGSSSGGGGGIAEKNVVFALLNLPRYLELCTESAICGVSAEDKKLLRAIADNLPREGQPIFESGENFRIEGQLKIARTGGRIGDPVYVNTDLLYPGGSPLSVTAAVALWVHELGHHHGVSDHQALDLLGSRVETTLLRRSQTIEGEPLMRNLSVSAFQPSAMKEFGQVLISDGRQLLDVTREIQSALSCQGIGEVIGGGVSNLHWVGAKLTPTRFTQRWQGRVILHCSKDGLFTSPIFGMTDVAVDLFLERKHHQSYLVAKPLVVPIPCNTGACH